MTKQNFMEQLIEELYRYFSPEQYQLEGSVLLKNNDTKRYAILLKKIEGTVSPTIYLDNFYSEFEHGRATIPETASHIYEQMHDFEDRSISGIFCRIIRLQQQNNIPACFKREE